MLRLSVITTASGAEQISGRRDHQSDLQQLPTGRARSVEALGPRALNHSDLRGRFRDLLLAFAVVRTDARKSDAWYTWSTNHGDQPMCKRESDQSAGNNVWYCRPQAAIYSVLRD